MRRFTLTMATGVAALVLLPAGAMAGTHARHHQRRHHVHHAIVHHAEDGTMQSFSGGVLTLALTDGTMVSGKVTDGTEVECEAADMSRLHADGDGGENGRGDNSGPGSGGDRGRGGDDNGDRGDDNGNQACMAADLVAGAAVRSAELRVSSAGAIWDKVELAG